MGSYWLRPPQASALHQIEQEVWCSYGGAQRLPNFGPYVRAWRSCIAHCAQFGHVHSVCMCYATTINHISMYVSKISLCVHCLYVCRFVCMHVCVCNEELFSSHLKGSPWMIINPKLPTLASLVQKCKQYGQWPLQIAVKDLH